MSNVVDRFGQVIQDICETKPVAARRMLVGGYHAKNVQLKLAPGKKVTRSEQFVGVEVMDAMIAPLAHAENSAMVSLFVPCELIQVAGMHPYSCEAFGCYLTGTHAEKAFLQHAENEGIPETFCSYHKIFIGAAEKGLMPKPPVIINTTLACDANLLTFRRLADYYQVPQYVIDVPFEQDEAALAYVAEQMRGMKAFIEKETGRKIEEHKLRAAVARSQRTMDNCSKAMTMRADKMLPGSLTGELYSAFATHILLGSEQSEDYTVRLLRDIKNARPACGKRLLWMHTNPYWVNPLRAFLNYSDQVQIVGSEMCYEGFVHSEPTDDPYTAMARRVVYSAYNGSITRRIERSLEVAKQVKADGVIYFCHWGCKHTLGGAQIVKKTMEDNGFPCLILDGDGCDRSHGGEGQMATRMEAFVEMLEGEKA